MGLFFDILSSINNPNLQGSVAQLESVINSVNQLSANYGIDSSKMQNVMSTVGSLIRPVLQQQKSLSSRGLESLISQFTDAGSNAAALQSLIPPQVQQQMVQEIAQITGLSVNQIQTALPTIISSVISLLNMGASKPGIPSSGNHVLNAFLDAEQYRNVNFGDVMKFADRFLNPPQAV